MRNKARFWLLVLVLLMSICFQPHNSYAATHYPYKAVNNLEHSLSQLERCLAKIEQDLNAHDSVSSHLAELAATMNRVDKLVQEIEAGFAHFEENIPLILEDKALQQLAYSRQAEMEAAFKQHWLGLVVLVDGLDEFSRNPKEKQLDIIKECRSGVSKLIAHQHNPLQVDNLPLKQVSWENNLSPKVSPPALSVKPTAEDVVPIKSPSVIQLAEKLDHDPLKMYRWVKDNIHYLPLFGSIKGPGRCLSDKEGSDFDQASLLIALFRSAKIPARYVYGQMKLPIETAATWLGVDETQTARAILQRGGIPYRNEVIRRVWVKAYIDNVWVELDPALKHCSWEDDTLAAEELSWVSLPPDELKQLQAALEIPNDSLKDIPTQRVIEPTGEESPANLSDSILTREWEATKVPTEFQYRLKVELGPTEGAGSSIELDITQVLTESLSLIYLPCDKLEARMLEALTLQLEDEADPKHKNIGHMPGYLVRVSPHLFLGDQIIAKGEPVSLGTPQYLSLSFESPLPGITPIRHLVVAGTCAALGLNMGGISAKPLNKAHSKPTLIGGLVGRLKYHIAQLLNEELGLGAFKDTALAYHQQNSRLTKLLARNTGVHATPFMGETLVSQAATVTYAFDMPVFFHNSGVNFDLQRNSFVLTPTDFDQAASRRFLAQAGVYSSVLEHLVLQQIEDTRLVSGETVSAVKALMIAQRQGIPLLHITSDNSRQMWPRLKVSQTILQDIEAAISKGYEVTLPQEEISLNDWRGVGYVVREAGTGAASYLINGGLAGSFGGTGGATTTISGSLPRGTWGKIIIIILILAALIIIAAM